MHEMTESIRLQILQTMEQCIAATTSDTTGPFRAESLYLLMVRCLVDLLKRPTENNNQLIEQAVAGLLLELFMVVEVSPFVRNLVRSRLFPAVLVIMGDDNRWKLLCHDLQITILRLSYYVYGPQPDTSTLFEASGGEWVCKHKNLNTKLRKILDLTPMAATLTVPTNNWPNKRPRLESKDEDISFATILASEVYMLLGNQKATDLAGLSKVAAAGYVKLSGEQQCRTVDTLGLLSCAYSGMLKRVKSGLDYEYHCAFCDSCPNDREAIPDQCKDGEDAEILETFKVLINLDEFNESATVKCRSMRSLRRVTNHTYDMGHLELEKSNLGSWCIGGLFSSKRELRIAAG